MSARTKRLVGAAVSLMMAGMVSAETLPFTINPGAAYGGTTASFRILQSNVNATSLYTAPIAVSSFDDLIGVAGVTVTDTSTAGQINGFLNGTVPLTPTDNRGLNGNYSLLFSYTLSGTAQVVDGNGNPLFQDNTVDRNNDGLIDANLAPTFADTSPCPIATPSGFCGGDAIVPNYTSGSITVTYRDDVGSVLGSAGATQKVLELDLVSATPNGPGVLLFAEADYSWYTPGSNLFVENFFNFVTPINGFTSWYQVWGSGLPVDPIQILTRSDFNIDPNAVPTSTCAPGNNCTTFDRTTNLNITTTVQVPEPGILALMGIALAGVAFGRRGKQV